MNIRKIIAARMKADRWTPHLLAEASGVNEDTLRSWLRGRTEGIGTDKLAKLADALGLEITQRAEGSAETPAPAVRQPPP